MDIGAILASAGSQDQATRERGELQLQQMRDADLGAFCQVLSAELANEAKPAPLRQLAGLIIKNTLAARDESMQAERQQAWMALDPVLRGNVKNAVLSALPSPVFEARHTAAQVVAAVAVIEVPAGAWPELLPMLVEQGMKPDATDPLRQSVLETIGFMCEEIAGDAIDQAATNRLLTVIVHGMQIESAEIKLAAATALLNTLEFASANFKNEGERSIIMEALYNATQSAEARVRRVAFECLVRIVSLYYELLQPYMQGLFTVTMKAARSDVEDVALQALEFWCTICEEESMLLSELRDAEEGGEAPERVSMKYAHGALQHLVALLTECMVKQDDEEEEDAWTVARAGSVCLSLLAMATEDDVVDPVMAFAQANVKNGDWHFRDAALMVIGAVMEGPSIEKLAPIVQAAVPLLAGSLASDPHVAVRDTAAWSLGRLLSFHLESVQPEHMPPLVTVLLKSLTDEPRVASNCCYALHGLAESVGNDDNESISLSPYFKDVVQQLVNTAERSDWDDHSLRESAYETINMFINHTGEDSLPLVRELLPHVVARLERSLSTRVVSTDDKREQDSLRGLLCGCLQHITQRLSEGVAPYADAMMNALLHVFDTKNAVALEEALMAIGALANALERDFVPHLERVKPFLMGSLANWQEADVCKVAAGVLSDVARACENAILPHCNDFVGVLLKCLEDPTVHRSVKPPVLGAFADIALAIGGDFAVYLMPVVKMLDGAGRFTVEDPDEDLIDYICQLRTSVLDGYTGIVQGLFGAGKGELLVHFASNIMDVVELVAQDPNHTEENVASAVGVVGDLLQSVPAHIGTRARQPGVTRLVQECKSLSNDSAVEVANWVTTMLASM